MSQDGPGPEQSSDDARGGAPGWQPPSGAASGGSPPPSQGGQGAYGAYGVPAAAPAHPSASTVLVLGILGLVVCGILAPFAWVKGTRTLREIDAQPGRWSGRDQVQIGRVLGIVGSVLLGLALVFALVMIVLFFVTAGAVISTSGF